ncbi:MAG: cysteine desulfurase family protein, partial [Bosea sp. (in: a-proteobacteria)]
AFGSRPGDVMFTSGATEALNTVLRPQAFAGRTILLVGATEHVAALHGHGFDSANTQVIPVEASGLLDLGWLAQTLAAHPGQAIIAVQAANNETGVLQPVRQIAALARDHGAVLVCDAVQMPGRAPCRLGDLEADVLVISAHKFGGPKGVGAIILGNCDLPLASPLLRGGGQELRRRPGTENLAGIAGMAAALAEAVAQQESEAERLANLRDELERQVCAIAPEAVFFGANAPRLPNTSLFAVPGLRADMLLMAFDLAGIAVSSGAACSSGKVARSHVLDAMGVAPYLAEGAIRASLGWTTTEADIAQLAEALAKIVALQGKTTNRLTG